MKLGLRIDVDTYRGTKVGVPNLCELFNEHHILASFFFSVGPDNMGRHIWRLLRPHFLKKMLRSKAASLYGWDILFKGTFWPGPKIGEKLKGVIRATSDAGHEIGLHAWDHHEWQAKIDKMDDTDIHDSIDKGFNQLYKSIDTSPTCSAVPGWKCSDSVLLKKETFPFKYNSDCRGESVFYPVINGKKLSQPQIPVTFPTYDEVIGRGGISDLNYNDYILSLFNPEKLNVLTIHAEVEGIAKVDLFRQFVETTTQRGITIVPLGALLDASLRVEEGKIVNKEIAGREGWVSLQGSL